MLKIFLRERFSGLLALATVVALGSLVAPWNPVLAQENRVELHQVSVGDSEWELSVGPGGASLRSMLRRAVSGSGGQAARAVRVPLPEGDPVVNEWIALETLPRAEGEAAALPADRIRAASLLIGSAERAPIGGQAQEGRDLFLVLHVPSSDPSSVPSTEPASEAGADPTFRKLRVPGLAGATPRFRTQPVAFTRSGNLEGLAWLQGDRSQRFEVWTASWEDGHFGEPQRVAPAGPGSQLALSGAELKDGSAVLVWSAFDGLDDEIVVSRRIDGQWQRALRLTDNAVPDITPKLVETEAGALVVFSRYHDGQYQLFSLDLPNEADSPTDDSMPVSRPLGPPGSMYPQLKVGGSEDELIRLVYLQASPRAWAVAEITASGEVTRTAAVPSSEVYSPIVLAEGQEWILRWASMKPSSGEALHRVGSTSTSLAADRLDVAVTPE